MVPSYQAMLDEWVTMGPSDEIADVVAGLILGEPTLSKEWVPRWRARPHESLARPGQALISRDDITDRLDEIEVPALVVHGTADVSITMDKAERLAAGLPRSGDVVVIDGGTHSANLTHPDAVNRAVLAFLTGLPI